MQIHKVMDIGIVIRLRDRLSDQMSESEKKALHELIVYYQTNYFGVSEDECEQNLFGDLLPPETPDKYPFDDIWKLYGRRGVKSLCKQAWDKLSNQEKKLVFDRIPFYVEATPDIQYRQHLSTYLNRKCWNDVVRDRRGNILFDPDSVMGFSDDNRPHNYHDDKLGYWNAYEKRWLKI